MKSPSSFSEPAREIPIAADVDLCVVGGGCTGTFAAIRAARTGLNVAVIEVLNQFGGAATSRAVNVWHSFWSTDGAVKIMGGLSEEAMERLRARGVMIEREKTDPAWQFASTPLNSVANWTRWSSRQASFPFFTREWCLRP